MPDTGLSCDFVSVQPFSPSSLAGLAPAAQQPNPSNDRQTLERLEHEWLQSEHDGPALQRLLADDFLHPVAAGVFLTKQQHIEWDDAGRP